VQCPNCGYDNKAHNRFCARCGIDLKAAAAPPAAAPPPWGVEPPGSGSASATAWNAPPPPPPPQAPPQPASPWGAPPPPPGAWAPPPPAPPPPPSAPNPFAPPPGPYGPPPGPYGPPPGPYGPPPGPYGQWAPYPPPGYRPASTNGFAIAALILGLVGWVPWGIGSLLAVVFGFVGRNQIRTSQGRQGGEGLAIAGIVLGFIGIALGMLLVLYVVRASRSEAPF